MVMSWSIELPAPGVIDGIHRECSMGWPLTKPLVSLSASSVTTSEASRWSYAASDAPMRAPGARRGAARPTFMTRVTAMLPSFFG